jgi:predicted HTH domain antitoxin
VLNFLDLSRKDLEKGLKRELAIHFFQSEVLSFGQARELSGMSVWDFIELLEDRNTPLHYGLLEYEEDSETVERLMKIGKLSPILHPLFGLSSIRKLDILKVVWGSVIIPQAVFHEVVILGENKTGSKEVKANFVNRSLSPRVVYPLFHHSSIRIFQL